MGMVLVVPMCGTARPCGSVLWNLLFRPDAGGVVCTVGHYQRRRIQGGTLAYGPKSGGGYVRDLGQRGSDSMSGPQPTVWEWNVRPSRSPGTLESKQVVTRGDA